MEVGAYEAKTQLPQLLARVARGERITITRQGRAIAELGPVTVPAAEAKRAALDDLLALREELQAAGIGFGHDEITAWKHEGRR